jgi:hydroxyacylglutathione hydrolase
MVEGIHLELLTVGPLETNCYIVSCEATGEAVIIDPAAETPSILRTVSENKLKLRFIINTHGHIDHTFGNAAIKEMTGVPILIHKDDAPMLTAEKSELAFYFPERKHLPPDRFLKDGDVISFGKVEFRVIHTPGHTPGGICLHRGKILFTGDTLFAGGVGRTDLSGGSSETLFNSIKMKLLIFSDDTVIFPGHGPSSTIGHERRCNPFL